MSDSFQELKTKLDNHHDWPEDYTFKFVVPKDQIDELLAVLPEGKHLKENLRQANTSL